MSDTIGNITVPSIAPSGTFPLVTDFPHTQRIEPAVAIHRFGSGNTKIEQRFLLGAGARRWQGQWADLYEDDLHTLKDFYEARRGPYQPFTLNVPSDDGTSTTAVTVTFEDEPLTWERLIHLLSRVGVTFVELPADDDAPSYSVADTVTRFPSGALETALESQVQELIPLVRIVPKEAGYPEIFLSDRRCTVGGQLYQARLLTWSGISQTLAGGPGAAAGAESDAASLTFGNADHVMRDLAADVDLFRARITFSLFHVGTGILIDRLWRGEIEDFVQTPTGEFTISAVDGLYDVTLQYPLDKISPTCGKLYDDGHGCPFSLDGGDHIAGTLDLVNFPSADSGSCDRGYLTANGCKAHTMKRFFPGVLAQPQSVRVKDNSAGFFGTGRPTITATSLVSDSMLGQPLVEIYTDVPMQVNGLIISGRDEGDFYEALAVIGAGPIQAYGRGQYDSGGNRLFHKLDGQPNHGDPGSLGLREVLGSDPAGATDYLSLDQSGNQTGGDSDKVYSGNSTYLDHFSAGVAFIVLRRTDAKGIQLTTLDQHTFEAIVSQGLQGWVWSEAGSRTLETLTNPVWIAVNVFLRGIGQRFATAEEAEDFFDVDAAIAAAAICDLSVDKIIGDGTETQFKFQGVLRELKVLKDWVQEILNNALGCWLFSGGKLKIVIREDAAAEASFTAGNIVFESLQLSPIRPAFNRLTVNFANVDYNFTADIIPVQDNDHIAYLGRTLDSQMNLAGAAGKSMAGRIGAVRLKEELGGVGSDERKAARDASWKTTVLALSMEPGKGVSITDDDVPGGTGLFRLTKWTLNPDMSIDMLGRTITDSMYDTVMGPKAADVPINIVPAEFFPEPLQSEWFPYQQAPPSDDAFTDDFDLTFGLAIEYVEQTDKGQLVRAVVSGNLAVNDFLDDTQPTIIRAQSTGTTGGLLEGETNYWARLYTRDKDGLWGPGSNIRHFSFEGVDTDDNVIVLSAIEWPAGNWISWVLCVGDDEKTICAQIESPGGGSARHFHGGSQESGGDAIAYGQGSGDFLIYDDLTFACWLRLGADSAANQWIFGYGSATGIGSDNVIYSLRLASTADPTIFNLTYRHRFGTFTTPVDFEFGVNLHLGEWYFVAMVRRDNAVFMYARVNGTLVNLGQFTFINAPDGGNGGVPQLCVGSMVRGAGLIGDMDAHYLWNRALSVAELREVMVGRVIENAKFPELDNDSLLLAVDLGNTVEVDQSSYNRTPTLEGGVGPSIITDGIVGPNFPDEITFTGPLKQATYNAPSPAHKFVRIKVKRLIHGGTLGAVVTGVTSGGAHIVFGGLAGTSDDWTDRLIYWAADASDNSSPPVHFRIATWDPVTGTASLTPDVESLSDQGFEAIEVGDLFYFRCEPDVFSTDQLTIGDTKIVNDIYPTGAVVNGAKGNVIRGYTAGKPHQIRRIASNESDRYTVDRAFDYRPDFFCVEAPNWEYFAETTPVQVPDIDVLCEIRAIATNLTAFPITVGAFLVDRKGQETPEPFAQIRDGYIFGKNEASSLTVPGTLVVYSSSEGADSTLPAGTDGYVLTADSSADSGFVWRQASEGGVSVKTADYTAVSGDTGSMLVMNSASTHTITLPNPAPSARWHIDVENIGAGLLTVSRNSLTIDGAAANVTVPTGTGLRIFSDGTNYFTQPGSAAVDAKVSFSDITTGNVSTTKHGFVPKAPNDATKFLDGTGAWSTPAANGGVSVKTADYTAVSGDAGKLLVMNSASAHTITLPNGAPSSSWLIDIANVGAGLLTVSRNSLTIDGAAANVSVPQGTGLRIFSDGTNYYTQPGLSAVDSKVSFSDITTGDVSTTKHGFTPKAPNDATKFLDGTGAWSTPATNGGVSVKTADYTAVSGDAGKLLIMNSASAHTITLPNAAPSSTWLVDIANVGAGLLTISRNSLTIDGAAANVSVPTGTGLRVFSDGTNYYTQPGLSAVDSKVSFSDITTGDVSTTKHGFTPKAPNDATKFLDGTGAWSTPAGASSNPGAGALVMISQQVLGGAAASVTFSSIPAGYQNLILTVTCRNSSGSEQDVYINFNGDTGSNYRFALEAAVVTNSLSGSTNTSTNKPVIASSVGASSNYPGSSRITIHDYANTTFYKNATSQNARNDGTTGQNPVQFSGAVNWSNTAAISSIVLAPMSGNFVTGSIFTLWAEVPASVGGVAVKTADYTALAADTTKLLVMNSGSAHTITLPNPAPSPVFYLDIQNIGAGTLTISRNSLTIDGAAADITVLTNKGIRIFSDGTNYFTQRGGT